MKTRKSPWLIHLATPLAIALGLTACDDVGDAPAVEGPQIITAAVGTCAPNENRDRQFPSGSDRIVLELTGGDIPAGEPLVAVAPKESETVNGEVVITGVPPGEGMTMRVVACAGAEAVWAGQTGGVAVAANTKSFPPVFLTPVAGFACTGTVGGGDGALSEPRAFAALASDGETAWAIGGFSAYTLASGATATGTIDRYDRLKSEVVPAGGLVGPRAMALAQRLADGRIKVIGGVRSATFGEAGRPAIYATAADAAASASEIYDPATGLSAVDEATPLPALPALAELDDGAVLAVGGVEAGGVGNADAYSANVTRFSASGAESGTLPGAGRYGATVVGISGETALIWGGNVDGDVANVGVLVDTGGPLAGAFTVLDATGVTEVPTFAAGARLDGAAGVVRVLIAGGSAVAPGPQFARDVAAPRLQVVTVDIAAATASVASVELGPLADAFSRAAGSLARLAGGEMAWFGGYTAFTSDPICGAAPDCIQTASVRFLVDGDDDAPAAVERSPRLDLSVGPLGAMAVPLGDGSWLMTGGLATVTGSSLDARPALLRYDAFESDLCGAHPLPGP